MTRLSMSACLQTQGAATRQARQRLTGTRARHAILAEVLATSALHPRVSHHGPEPNKQRRLYVGLCPAVYQCWRARFTVDPSTGIGCMTRPVWHFAFPSTHSVATISCIRGNGKAPSIPPQTGPTTCPRTEQVKAKAVTNTRFGGLLCSKCKEAWHFSVQGPRMKGLLEFYWLLGSGFWRLGVRLSDLGVMG